MLRESCDLIQFIVWARRRIGRPKTRKPAMSRVGRSLGLHLILVRKDRAGRTRTKRAIQKPFTTSVSSVLCSGGYKRKEAEGFVPHRAKTVSSHGSWRLYSSTKKRVEEKTELPRQELCIQFLLPRQELFIQFPLTRLFRASSVCL